MYDHKEYMKKYNAEHRTEHTEYMRRWRLEHPDRVKEQNHEQYLKRKARKEAEREVKRIVEEYKTLLTDAIRKITEAREIWMFHHGEDVDADWCADVFDSTTDRLKQMIHWEDDTQTTPWEDSE